jgi:DNA-binding response OmpR family regulator
MRRGPVILVADDERAIRHVVAQFLDQAFPGASIVQVADPYRVPHLAFALRPQLILLDWVFERGMTGPSICRRLKAQPPTRTIPIILMTGQRTGLQNRVETVRSGADVFLRKPFTREELVALTRALLERDGGRSSREIFRLGGLTLRREERSVWLRSSRVAVFSKRAFDLLWYLARHSPRTVAKEDIVRFVFKNAVRDKHADLAIARLRRKLSPRYGIHIETIPGSGYRLVLR